MFKKIIWAICLLLLNMPIFVIAAGETSSVNDLQKEYGSLQKIPKESVAQSTSDDLIIKNVNNSYYTKETTPDGYTHAILTGSVHIVYETYDIYADEVVIKFIGGKAKVVVAKGNVLLVNKNKNTLARTIFIYLDNHDVQVLDSITLQNNVYVRGVGIRYNHKDLVHLEDVSMTTSLRYIPRYSINGATGWLEQDNDFILFNAYLTIGQDPIIYFPFFYNNHYGTGIITNIAYDAYLGFIINNTFTQNTPVSSENFMVDYYEKLGFYMGNDYSRTDIGSLHTHVGMAYDYHTMYENGTVQNIFEQVLGQGPTSERSLRYNFGIDYDNYIYKSDDPNGFSLRYKGTFKELSDPDFESQFETNRSGKFDPKSLVFSNNLGYEKVQSSNHTGVEGRRIDNGLEMQLQGYDLKLSSSYLYALNPGGNLNSFSPHYWKNQPSSQTMPRIDFNKSFLLYNINPQLGGVSKLQIPIKFDVNYSFINQSTFQTEGLQLQDITNNLDTALSMSFKYNYGSFFTLTLPFLLDNSIIYDNLKYYNYEGDGTLSSNSNKTLNTLTANYSPTMVFNVLDNVAITNTNAMKSVLTNNKIGVIYQADASTNTNNDDHYTYDQTLGELLEVAWSQDWDYLSGYVYGAYTYDRFHEDGRTLNESAKILTNTHTVNLVARFFETTITTSFANNIGTNVSGSDAYDPLNIVIESTAIPYLTVADTYVWDRYYKRGTSNDFSLITSIPSRVNLSSWLWFHSLDIAINWTSNMENSLLDYLTYKFAMVFNITDLWQISFGLSGKNQNLYLYGSNVSGQQKTNFFVDLLKSFAIWSTRLRQESHFKMSDLDIIVSHDLDEWVLKSGITLEPKSTSSGKFYFDTQFYVEVILKDLGMLSAPRIAKGSNTTDEE